MARLAFGALAYAPPPLAERVGRWLGRLAYRLGWRRRVVETQLAGAFPDRDDRWVGRTARACFEHVGRELLSLPRATRRGLAEVRGRIVETEGLDVLREAFGEGRGLVVVTGHFGNWELAGASLAAFGFPMDAVVQSMKNPFVTRYVRRVRERLGMGLIDRVDAWERLTESLAAGRIVAFAADQDARERGVFVPFFGRPASTHRAPALLAVRARVPFFVGGVYRVGPRRYRLWVRRLEPPAGCGVREQVRELTRRWSEELERRIRLSPEQYFWHHKRWKTAPPGTDRAAAGITD